MGTSEVLLQIKTAVLFEPDLNSLVSVSWQSVRW